MKKKIIIAGTISGIAISVVEYIIHGIIMHPVYAEWAEKGVMEIAGKPFGFIHYPVQFLLGFPIVYLYSLASAQFKRTIGLTIFIGILTGIFCLSITTALYSFYNLGTIIPVVITIDKLFECIVCCFISEYVIKEKL